MIRTLRLLLVFSLLAPPPAWASGIARVVSVRTSVNAPAATGAASAPALRLTQGQARTSNLSLDSALPGASSVSPTVSAAKHGAPAAMATPAAAKAARQAPAASAAAPSAKAAAPVLRGESARTNLSAAADRRAAAPASAVRHARPADGWSFNSLGKLFDGARQSAASGGLRPAAENAAIDHSDVPTDRPAEQEEVTSEIAAEPEPDPLDLRFSRAAKKDIMGSDVYASIRLINGSGSQWYWEQFAPDMPLRVLVGGRMAFFTRITGAETKTIASLTRKDLEGHYSRAIIYGTKGSQYRYSVPQLRKRMIQDLTKLSDGKPNAPRVIGLSTKVRVMQFMPYKEARQLPENEIEPDMEPRVRKPVDIPESLAGLKRFLPKVVLVDLKLFEKDGSIPFDLFEDMGKLMKAGVFFVFLSDRPQDGPGSVEEMIKKGLTLRQRDDVVRYKLLSLSYGGNSLYEYRGAFSRRISARRFPKDQLEMLEHAALTNGAAKSLVSEGYEFTALPKKGVAAADVAEGMKRTLAKLGVGESEYTLSIGERGKDQAITFRPTDLPSAIPQLMETLRTQKSLYVNNSDMMVVSRDKAILDATAGAVQPAADAPKARGADLVETSLAAMLGAYRENVPGDLAASASSMASFKYNKGAPSGSFDYKIYMLLGHVMHAAFNWAIWVYRDTGVLPPLEELIAKSHEIWRMEDNQRIKHLLDRPGESTAGYMEAMEKRLRSMHAATAHILERYPIAVGTELPNLFVQQRYKKGERTHRDIFRFIFDFVVARETEEGLELVVVDFKSGQTSTMQTLAKDIQAQLYDVLVRKLWPTLSVPYGANGKLAKVVKTGVSFIYPPDAYTPEINEWDRVRYEKWLRNMMNRIRKHKAGPPAPKARKTAAAKKDSQNVKKSG
ncbi:MAG: PD-(D/E)XK nuclease family protein [Elusimicrobiota bacterium]